MTQGLHDWLLEGPHLYLSRVLDEEVVMATDDAEIPPEWENRVVYRESELARVAGMDADGLVRMHLVKAAFPGSTMVDYETGLPSRPSRTWTEADLQRAWDGWGEQERARYLSFLKRARETCDQRMLTRDQRMLVASWAAEQVA